MNKTHPLCRWHNATMRHNSCCFISIEKHHIADLLETGKKTMEIFYVAIFSNGCIDPVVLDLLLVNNNSDNKNRRWKTRDGIQMLNTFECNSSCLRWNYIYIQWKRRFFTFAFIPLQFHHERIVFCFVFSILDTIYSNGYFLDIILFGNCSTGQLTSPKTVIW